MICIQDTLSSRALGLAAAFRPSASREQRYLAYKYMIILNWDFDVLPITFDDNFILCSLAELMNYD